MTRTEEPFPIMEQWRLVADGAGELMVVGLVRTRTVQDHVVSLDERQRLVLVRSGLTHRLGDADPSVIGNPYALLEEILRPRLAAGDLPSEAELAVAPELSVWTAVTQGGHVCLQGVVRDHPRLPDDHVIVTSPLLWLHDDGAAARTISRWYRLRTPLAELAVERGMADDGR
jgi:hypothetical protein